MTATVLALLALCACGSVNAADGTPASTAPTTTSTAAPEASPSSTDAPTTTTTKAAATTTSKAITTTTATVANAPSVEAWWCEAIEEAKANPWTPDEFAQFFVEALEGGFTNAPTESIEEATEQLRAAQCFPDYGMAAADALGK